jgi:hypothetical protein
MEHYSKGSLNCLKTNLNDLEDSNLVDPASYICLS